jgi:hypothetical protein
MLHTLHFFLFTKCRLFYNATFFGSCIIHILYTVCAKKIKKNSGAKRLIKIIYIYIYIRFLLSPDDGDKTSFKTIVFLQSKRDGRHFQYTEYPK